MLKKQKKRGKKKGWSFLLSPTCQGCLGEGRHHHHVLGDDSYNRYKIQTMVAE
jgi:hypothetical protein